MKVRRFLFLPMVLVVGAAAAVTTAITAAGVASAATLDTAQNIAVSSWGTDRFDVFARATDGTVQHKVFDGRWSAWENLGGNVTSGPAAVSMTKDRIDIFARSSSGSLVHQAYSAGSWASAWDDLGGTFVGTPAVSSWGDGRMDVFVRGTDNAMHHKAYDRSGGGWSGWGPLGGAFNANPTAVSWAKNRIDVFGRGAANQLFHRFWNGSAWSSSWENLGGNLTSSPSAMSGQANYITVYARNTSNQLQSDQFSPSGWAGWTAVTGGTMGSAPAAASKNSAARTDVFSFDANGVLQQRTWNGFAGWGAWTPVPESGAALPTVPYTATVATQLDPNGATLSSVVLAYVDNIGRLTYATTSPDALSNIVFTVVSGSNAFTGPVGLTQQVDANHLVQISGLNSNGDVWSSNQASTGSNQTPTWVSRGGQFGGAGVRSYRQTDNTVTLLTLDPAGGLWSLQQPTVGTDLRTWTYLNIRGLTALPVATQAQSGLNLFAVDSAGAVETATLATTGVVSSWTSLGGSGFTNSPAAVVVPGFRNRLLVRQGDGTLVTKMQDASLAWPAAWTAVGTQTGVGSPAAMLVAETGRIMLLTRGPAAPDGTSQLYVATETGQGSGTFGAWTPAGSSEVATDPTTFAYTNSSGSTEAFTYRTVDQLTRIFCGTCLFQ